MKNGSWTIINEDKQYKIELIKNKLIINNNTPIPISVYWVKELHFYHKRYQIPIGMKYATLHTFFGGNMTLEFDGKDCSTGLEYIHPKIPKWTWVFMVLYILSFALVMGGAVGVLLNGVFALITLNISVNLKSNTAIKVLSAIGLFVLTVVIETVIQTLIYVFYNYSVIKTKRKLERRQVFLMKRETRNPFLMTNVL